MLALVLYMTVILGLIYGVATTSDYLGGIFFMLIVISLQLFLKD